MRRENRRKNMIEGLDTKKMLYIIGTILALAVIAFVITFIIYGNVLNESSTELGKLNTSISDAYLNGTVEETSTSYGKTVNEVKESSNGNTASQNQTNTEKVAVNTSNVTKDNSSKTNTTKTETTKTETKKTEETKKEEKVPDPKFKMPVEGEIIKEFANNKLVYSATLDVWAAHNGIDIKADKTTVVKAAAEGTVESIKNDPRYGLTVIIEHVNGYKTVYANLLSTEFVVAGEKVKQGQSIGTVGNTATFEISDEPHLHFELLKDNEQQDPELYLE